MLVSAIMPTAGRPAMAARAVECFTSQTWPEKELVIVDDTKNPSFPNGIEREDIQYIRLDRQLEIGAKRNICCARAYGEVIVHFDDDDFSAPTRIADQVQRLVESEKAVTGYVTMVFYNSNGERWFYHGGPECALGTSLCYRRDWWLHHPFPVMQIGEDGEFVRTAYAAKQLVVADSGELMHATNHSSNTCSRKMTGAQWRRM